MTFGKSHILPLLAAMWGLTGCMSTEADLTAADLEGADIVEVEPTRIALHKSASTLANEVDGYCERGVGVYLSAAGDTAELTLYAVTPAELATFERPTLHLTIERDGERVTESVDFESVTLHAGESRAFSAPAEGTLIDVAAEVFTQ